MSDESYYKERGEERNWPKLVLIILGAIILALIIFLLIKGCAKNNQNGDMERDLLGAGKEYYSTDITLLPQATGECDTVTLGTLLEEELITTPENYTDCNNEKTYVKVCKLESGSYHYLPVLQCGSTLADDNFTAWKDGSESNLVADKSDVRFTFKGEKQEVQENDLGKEEEAWLDELTGVSYKTVSSTKYYRYRDLMWKWQTTSKEYYSKDTSIYYASAPDSSYANKEGTTTGWKWYTTVSNGKTWQKTSDPTVTTASLFKYICYDGEIKQSSTTCGEGWISYKEGNGYICVKGNFKQSNDSCSTLGTEWKEYGKQYSCDNKNIVSEGTVCSITCPEGTMLNSDKTECGKMVESTTRKYYPSNSANASGEKNYYLQAPVSGAIKDESTATSVSRYFKTVTKTTDKYYATAPSSGATKVGEGVWGNWSDYQTTQPKAYANTRQIETRTKVVFKKITNESNLNKWVAISDDYLSEADLITKFKSLGYKVNTLEDIEQAKDLRYQIKLQYRDRK